MKHFHGMRFLPIVLLSLTSVYSQECRWECVKRDAAYSVQLRVGEAVKMVSPKEGLWSIALGWEEDAPAKWESVPATEKECVGDWTILRGKLVLPQGEIVLRDAYTMEKGMLKCVRRWEYRGKEPLTEVTLSVIWRSVGENQQAFLPGILYYGNPSGEKNRPQSVPVFHGRNGEFAFFEEHRYPMPFAALEDGKNRTAAVLHSVPTPALRGNVPDQWWSLGVRARETDAEIALFSGFIGYNGQNSVAKALQRHPMKYPQSTMTLRPGTVVEKTFYLDAWQINRPGVCFQKPIRQSLSLFQPYSLHGLPTRGEILKQKFAFARSRWIEGETNGISYAGFNMYPAHVAPRLVMGWCGQAASVGYALQVLEPEILRMYTSAEEKTETQNWIRMAVQRSLDHLATSPVDEEGFSVEFEPSTGKWLPKTDYVSMGQGMYNFAKAIASARNNKFYDTSAWEAFLRKACAVQARRILQEDWRPRSTAEGFLMAPLILAYQLFDEPLFRQAAEKAASHYAQRHLSMEEPYWGGTLDAQCEDKEGAWAAFQGFLHLYEVTGEKKYLDWARHACDVCLSYTVVWDIPLPPGRLADHAFKTRGWTVVSPQNQHLDVYAVLYTPEISRMGELLQEESYRQLADVMFCTCGQLIDPFGSQGEQIQQTNFAQHGDMSDVLKLRGGYSESWTVFWITAHFLNAQARMLEIIDN